MFYSKQIQAEMLTKTILAMLLSTMLDYDWLGWARLRRAKLSDGLLSNFELGNAKQALLTCLSLVNLFSQAKHSQTILTLPGNPILT